MPEIPPPVDGIRADAPTPSPVATPPARAKKLLVTVGGALYGAYALWCIGLLLTLPDPSGSAAFASAGAASALMGGAILLGLGALFLLRIARADASPRARRRGFLRATGILLPGLALSALVPLFILREPGLPLDIVEPASAEDLVAPVTVTFSAERAVAVLVNLGLQPSLFLWDTDGDGQPDDQGLIPRTTTTLRRPGTYAIAVRIQLANGESRRIARSVTVPRAVFSLMPPAPVIEQPVQFSVAHLLADPTQLAEVRWDFDGDGAVDETAKGADALHTYYTEGKRAVTAAIVLQSGIETTYRRTVTVGPPPPLPFPVTLASEPKHLVGPVPFGVLFSIATSVGVGQIDWSFGDGKNDSGKDLKRIGHVFEAPGIYPVTARVRSQTGAVAELTTLVRATEVLALSDLRFDGSPDVQGGKLSGEVPLSIQLTPQTSQPLVQFAWEVPEGFVVRPEGATLQGVFRRQGTYTLTLVAQDSAGRAARVPLEVEVRPPGAEPSFRMQPEGGVAPLTVTFDASETFIPPGTQVAGFEWTFGDEEGSARPELGAARTEHTYAEPGEYTAMLRVVMSSGQEFTAQRTIVVRRPTLNACITTSRVRVQTGKGVEFDSSCSTGILAAVLWDIRSAADPSAPVAQSPEPRYVHVFDAPGTYAATLTVTDGSGRRDAARVTITVTP